MTKFYLWMKKWLWPLSLLGADYKFVSQHGEYKTYCYRDDISSFVVKDGERQIISSITSLELQKAHYPNVAFKICPHIIDFREYNRTYGDPKRSRWVVENLKGLWYCYDDMVYYFELPEDAMAFKLVWF